MISSITEILICLSICLVVFYYYLTNDNDTWKKRNIAGPKPLPIFGNFKNVILGKIHLADYIKQVYDTYESERVVGLTALKIPVLIVRDPEIMKEVLIKSFWNFGDRGFNTHNDIDPLSQHLLYMTVEEWKPMRHKLSPVFTSVKLKEMFYLVSECAQNFIDYTELLTSHKDTIDCHELASKYTIDVIGVCAFGLDTKALSGEESEFERVGKHVCRTNFKSIVKKLIRVCPHWMATLIKPIIKDDDVVNFFVNIIKENIEYRTKNNIRKNDFVDLLIDIKNDLEGCDKKDVTLLLTAQAYIFFIGGFDTTATTITHALYEMALNPEIQNKLREEIKITLKNNKKLNYEDLKNMKYMDKIFKETLRMYPPGYFSGRSSANDYTFPHTKISIPKGTKVVIPVHAIHYDSNYYPQPYKFDPERFNEEFERMRHPMCYLPFGAGPRYCIGKRFAHMVVKLGLANLIQCFQFEVCEKTCIPYEKTMGRFILSPRGGLYLKIKKI